MLPKFNRISDNNEIRRILKNGRIFRSDSLIFKFSENSLTRNRFAFVIAKKQAAKAVLRNKLKRRLTEAIKLKAPESPQKFDVVLIVLAELAKKDFREIADLIEKFFSRLWLKKS